MEYQHKWNTYMEGQYELNKINISNVPIVQVSLFVRKIKEWKAKGCQGTSCSAKEKTKSAKVSTSQILPPYLDETEDEEEEEDVHVHLGRAEPLTKHFTMASASFDEDNWQSKWAIVFPLTLSFFPSLTIILNILVKIVILRSYGLIVRA